MRPRPDAAENGRVEGRADGRGGRFNEAAARCRGKPFGFRLRFPLFLRLASMRPRPDAAENAGEQAPRGVAAGGFNEAAARCRGKRCAAASAASPVAPLQ